MSAELILVLKLGGLALVVGVIVAIVIWRKRKKKAEYDDAVARLLQQTGGREIPDLERLRLRSASLRRPFTGIFTGGMVDTMTQASVSCRRGFDLPRGQWLLRVAEMKFHRRGAGNAGPTILHENVIETATASPLPTMRIAPTLPETSVNVLGISSPAADPRQANVDEEIARAPAGARSWQEVRLPPAYAATLRVFAEDTQAAMRALNPTSLPWLAQYAAHLQGVIALEQGVGYLTDFKQLAVDDLLPRIDAFIGFLQRIPAQPGDTAGAGAGAQGESEVQQRSKSNALLRNWGVAAIGAVVVVAVLTFLL